MSKNKQGMWQPVAIENHLHLETHQKEFTVPCALSGGVILDIRLSILRDNSVACITFIDGK